MHGGRPAVPVGGCPAVPAGAAGDAGLRWLLFALGPVPAGAGCQLRLKPKLCRSRVRARGQRDRRWWWGEKPGWGELALGMQGACAAERCLLWDVWIAGGLGDRRWGVFCGAR